MTDAASSKTRPVERLLAIESATKRAGAALLQDGEVTAEIEGGERDHHAERLLPMIDELLGTAGWKLAEVSAFAISLGPGGFTSLRIGLATLKGLAFGSGLPVAAVSTLEVLAHAAWTSGRADPDEAVCALLDARRGELYAGAYRRAPDGASACVLEDCVIRPAELARRLEGRVRLVGEGAALCGAEIAGSAEQAQITIDPGPTLWPTAASVGLLGRAALAAGRSCAAGSLVPRYLRRAQAEEVRAAQRAD